MITVDGGFFADYFEPSFDLKTYAKEITRFFRDNFGENFPDSQKKMKQHRKERKKIFEDPTFGSADIFYEDFKYKSPAIIAEGDKAYIMTRGAYTQSYSSVYFN